MRGSVDYDLALAAQTLGRRVLAYIRAIALLIDIRIFQ